MHDLGQSRAGPLGLSGELSRDDIGGIACGRLPLCSRFGRPWPSGLFAVRVRSLALFRVAMLSIGRL